MKTFTYTSLALALTGLSNAYPSILAELESQKAPTKRQLSEIVPPVFDAASQHINVTGAHAFNAPGPRDQRGPCPGLNAMANHGYLPHNGVATIAQFIKSTGQVFGMGLDLSTILSVYGAAVDGNLLEWSIGGPTANVPSINLLGEPQGISGSHNKYESDVSPTRGDLYEDGQDYLLKMSNFQALYDLGKAEDNYDLDILTAHRYNRFNQNIQQNPYFFNGPFSGVVVQPAAYTFIYRFMANKSSEYPEGRLNGEVLKSFFSITGNEGNFTYTPGHERIPENWYTRNIADPYTVAYFNVDLVSALLAHIEFASIGGNTGTVNSFAGLDPANLTGGVYELSTLTKGNNLLCYAMELTVQALPDLLSGLFTDVDTAMDKVGPVFNNATNSLGCPKLNNIDKDQFNAYPGYTKLNADGAY